LFQEAEIKYSSAGFRPIDIATLAYLLFEMAVVLIFLRQGPIWMFLIGIYLLGATLVVLFSAFQIPGPRWRTFRLIYPLLIMIFLYEVLDYQIFIFHSGPLDNLINSLEMAVLGFDASFALQRYISVTLNEVMSLSYLSYYFIPPAAFFLFLINRRWDALERTVLSASVAFYACYAIFIFFPIVGPRLYLENIYYLPLSGPVFTPLTQRIVAEGGLHGGAMPSSHCAVALAITWFLAREFRKIRIPLILLLATLCISTVYGRYHYMSDVIAGLLVGALSIALTSRWQNCFLARQEVVAALPEAEIKDAVGAGFDV
jgi:membrane-associated phospholipid phosphatase